MLLIAATPLSKLILEDMIGISGSVLIFAREVLLLMCILPGLILWRNYYHGLLMVMRKTTGMAMGGITRVAGIYLMAHLLFVSDLLDHLTGTIILLLGFLLEACVVMLVYKQLVKK